jgi:hypothetical protein
LAEFQVTVILMVAVWAEFHFFIQFFPPGNRQKKFPGAFGAKKIIK